MSVEQAKPVLAVFDFDETITYVDSFAPFLRHVSGRGPFIWKAFLCSPALLALKLGLISNERAKVSVLRRFFSSVPELALTTLADNYVREKLDQLVNPQALERIKWHQQSGHRVVILSASLENYLRPWAVREGIEDIACTRLRCVEQRISGELEGMNCHGEQKVQRLREMFGDLESYTIYAYGDSRSDLPVLALATHRFFRSFAERSFKAKVARRVMFWRALFS